MRRYDALSSLKLAVVEQPKISRACNSFTRKVHPMRLGLMTITDNHHAYPYLICQRFQALNAASSFCLPTLSFSKVFESAPTKQSENES